MSDQQENIPSGKVQRAGRFFKTGMKVSGNYIRHYSKKAFVKDASREELDKKNADDIFNLLTQLKGTALKIAQMLSMDTGLLPKEYADKFKEAHYNNMALSGPLILNTFMKYAGRSPYEMFDKFNPISVRAASIGQVHEAWKDGKKLAVKIQYPGVSESIHSDINLVKPLFLRAFGLKAEMIDHYLEEIVSKLVEETDYEQELRNGIMLAEKCASLDYVAFPKYYQEYSSEKILTMEWLEGIPFTEYIPEDSPIEERNKIGQHLLDFIHYQLHSLRQFHADMHPGNYLVMPDGRLGAIDFGCVKSLPEPFYHDYFGLIKAGIEQNETVLKEYMYKLDFLRKSDDESIYKLFYETTYQTIELVAKPLRHKRFYFGDKDYFDTMAEFGMEAIANKEFRKPSAFRGPKDAIYLHRTFFGLYNILHELNATVNMDLDFLDMVD